jgi:hypothetical protein
MELPVSKKNRNTDGYKPAAVPKALQVIHGRMESEAVDSLNKQDVQQEESFSLPEVLCDGSVILVSRENHRSLVNWFEKYAGWRRSGKSLRETLISTQN